MGSARTCGYTEGTELRESSNEPFPSPFESSSWLLLLLSPSWPDEPDALLPSPSSPLWDAGAWSFCAGSASPRSDAFTLVGLFSSSSRTMTTRGVGFLLLGNMHRVLVFICATGVMIWVARKCVARTPYNFLSTGAHLVMRAPVAVVHTRRIDCRVGIIVSGKKRWAFVQSMTSVRHRSLPRGFMTETARCFSVIQTRARCSTNTSTVRRACPWQMTRRISDAKSMLSQVHSLIR